MKSSYTADKDIVLIVDDNITNLQIAISMLKEENYEVAIASNRKETEQILDYMKPDLILMDVMMPETDGFELSRQLKSNPSTKEIPVIFLTSLRQTEDVVKGFSAGGADFISKPFKKEELMARIKNVLNLKKSEQIILQQNLELKKLISDKNGIIEITAHDLNNPLQAIMGMTEILDNKDFNPDQEALKKIIGTIRNASRQAIQIIRDLTEIHKLEDNISELNITRFDLVNLLYSIKKQYDLIASQKKIGIIFETEIREYSIETDENKFGRIIDNLLSNALKFSPKNSEVKIRLSTIKSNSMVKVEIIDNGPGISETDKDRIFKKYSKLSAKPTGGETSTGLGLSIVKLIAEKLKLKVGFESEIGKGSVFYIEI